MFKFLPSSCRSFCSKVSCFPLSATCYGSHRERQPWGEAEAALEYLDFLDKKEPFDGSGVISDDDGSAISLPSDAGLEISGTEANKRSKIERWEVLDDEGDDGDDEVCVLGGAGGERDVRGVWRRERR